MLTIANKAGGEKNLKKFSISTLAKGLRLRFYPETATEESISSKEFLKKAKFVDIASLAGGNTDPEDEETDTNNDNIAKLYLGHNYLLASGLKYITLDDNIGYVRCETFEEGVGDGNVSSMLQMLATCNGLIIDIRGNGGGHLDKAHTLASHFTNEKILVGYISHKTGKGHNDFSAPEAEYLDPASDGIRWQKPVVVLTNRSVYSAANDFVKCMKQCPNVTIMGDQTGGGSGMPFNSDLPNGWHIRYSAVIFYDRNMHHTEFGIQPDITLSMSGADIAQKKDTYIEQARAFLGGGM